jgi:ABC-type amino acid transport substrate-binding protein
MMLRRCLMAFLLGSLPLLAQPQPRVVTLAVDDAHPPYTQALNGEAVGVYVKVLVSAMREMPDWQLRLLVRPWARALQESRQGLVDGFLPPYKEVNREWVAAFAGPLHTEDVVLSCGPQLRIGPGSRWPIDFANLRIGTTRAYLLSHALSAAFENGQIVQREYRQGRDALAALAQGDIDCYGNDLLDIEQSYSAAMADRRWASRMPKRLEPHFVLTSQKAYVGFSAQSMAQRPELAGFIEALNVRLAQMRANGEIKRMIDEAHGAQKR